MKSAQSKHTETSPKTIHSVEASDEEKQMEQEHDHGTKQRKADEEEPDTVRQSIREEQKTLHTQQGSEEEEEQQRKQKADQKRPSENTSVNR